MKKSLSLLAVCVLLLGLFPTFAHADVITPVGVVFVFALELVLIALAVIVIAAIIRRILRKKK